MAAYVIGEVEIHDPEDYKEYAKRRPGDHRPVRRESTWYAAAP